MYALTYHKINDPENFEKQLIYLKKNFNIIHHEVMERCIVEGCLSKKPSLLLTFDDGDISNYTIAFPLLKKHGLSAILFVVTSLLNTNQPFWWDEIQYYLGNSEAARKVWEVKMWSNADRLAYLKELRENSDKPELRYSQLSTAQLNEMQQAGFLIGNHSHTHPMFDKCTPEELDEELQISCLKLQELGFSPQIFAYPNGNFSAEAEKKLVKHGIEFSFLFDHKINKGKINPLRISRLIVNDTTPLWKFKLILSGWHSKILPLTRALGKLRK